MPRFENKGVQVGKIVEEYAILSESEKSDWVTAIASISWSDKEPKTEIRKYNRTYLEDKDPKVNIRGFGKGIALTDEEYSALVVELIRMGYGNIKEIQDALKARK